MPLDKLAIMSVRIEDICKYWGPDEYPNILQDIDDFSHPISQAARNFVDRPMQLHHAYELIDHCCQKEFLINMWQKQHNIIALAHEAANSARQITVVKILSEKLNITVTLAASFFNGWIEPEFTVRPWAPKPWVMAFEAIAKQVRLIRPIGPHDYVGIVERELIIIVKKAQKAVLEYKRQGLQTRILLG